jgi:transposase-like protein
MYLAGVSMRRVEDITEALWGTRVSAGTVSDLSQRVYGQIETWRSRPIKGVHPYVFLDGIWLKRAWGSEVRNVSVLVAIGVDGEGFREVLGVADGCKEDRESWAGFLRHLKDRGLSGVRLVVSDKCLGLVESLGEFFPEAAWQRCMVHFYRNVFSVVPKGKVKEVAAMLKAIHAQEDRQTAREKAAAVAAKLDGMKLARAAAIVREGCEETFSYYAFPPEHWRSLRTNNPLERLNREIRRRTRVVGGRRVSKTIWLPDPAGAGWDGVEAGVRTYVGTRWENKIPLYHPTKNGTFRKNKKKGSSGLNKRAKDF